MLFREIKANAPVYLLDKRDMNVVTGKVSSVVGPKVQTNPQTGKQETAMDITIDAEGYSGTYNMPDGIELTTAGMVVLSTSSQGIVDVIDAMEKHSGKVLAEREYHETVLKRSGEARAKIDPVYREQQKTEQRFNSIEGTIQGLGGDIAEMKSVLSKLVEKLEGEKK